MAKTLSSNTFTCVKKYKSVNIHFIVQPHFNYCNIVWGNCGVTLQDKLQKLQNRARAARVLTYSNYDAHVNNSFELLRWKSLVSQRQIERATMVFKSLQGLAPEYFCSKIVHRDSGYCLRETVNKVNIPQPRTNYYKNSFSYLVIKFCGTVDH